MYPKSQLVGADKKLDCNTWSKMRYTKEQIAAALLLWEYEKKSVNSIGLYAKVSCDILIYRRLYHGKKRKATNPQGSKDRKEFANDLKTIYHASNEEQGRQNRDRISKKWSEKYPLAMKRWERDWDVITPIFKFSSDVRVVIYTTNAIESLNATYRKLNRQRSVFPSSQALLKALYLATFEATKAEALSSVFFSHQPKNIFHRKF